MLWNAAMPLSWRKAKIPISVTTIWYFIIFATTLRAVAPHFRFEKDFNFYLNSSRAAPRVGISPSFQQTGGNSNLNIERVFYLFNRYMDNAFFQNV